MATITVSSRDYKFYSPRHKFRRSPQPAFGIPVTSALPEDENSPLVCSSGFRPPNKIQNQHDHWLQGKSIAKVAPNLILLVPRRTINQRTVCQTLQNGRWIGDIIGAFSVSVLDEYLRLWDLLAHIILQHGAQDQHSWRLTKSGLYSSKSACNAYFVGSTRFAPWKHIWKSWAPLRCKFFVWLAVLNHCWTEDRLARRGLPHPSVCPLCDQAEETIQHLLISCVFARQVWFIVFQKFGLHNLVPQPDTSPLSGWWYRVIKGVDKQSRKDLNTFIILIMWELWKHRNDRIFNNVLPSLNLMVRDVQMKDYLVRCRGQGP
ncbi:uncharacterized protein LOC133931081 [Phragmites australis]|uniref:uncharacterized protein LOC133931081 n=1 Tax=Phragmites australis TaxID=29695 RepID=UPI002D7895A5|nr:uncharacterized protein LOC133931081 [Phragmites australis]